LKSKTELIEKDDRIIDKEMVYKDAEDTLPLPYARDERDSDKVS